MSMFDDLEGSEFTGRNSAYGNAGAPFSSKIPAGASELGGHYERCRKCGGSGMTRWGACFACQGKGGKTFKQPAAVRAVAREKAADRRVRSAQVNLDAFKTSFPAEWAWIESRVRWEETKAPDRDFGRSLRDAIMKYGDLSEGRMAAVRSNMAKRAAAIEARQAAPAPAVTVERIEQAFATAAASGLSKLTLRLATASADGSLRHAFRFTPAPATGKNPGAIYVKEGEEYLGKIVAGRFQCVASCGDERRDDVVKAASDPTQAAVAYGKLLGSCGICGRELSDPESVARGIGPVCSERYGL